MLELVRTLDLRNVTLFGQDWGGLIGLRVVTADSDRFSSIVVSNTALPAAIASSYCMSRRRADSSSSVLGEKAALMTGIWAGWMAARAPNPIDARVAVEDASAA